jgi:acyl transferase domain-containing protein
VSSFGFGGSNTHIVLDDAYNFLRMRNLIGNHSTIHEPPSPRLLELTSVDYRYNGTSDTNDRSELDRGREINGTAHLSNRINRSNGISEADGIIPPKAPLVEAGVLNGFDQKVLVWSAADEDGIARLAAAWAPYFSNLSIPDSEKTDYLCDLAHTLAVRRSNLPWKTFAIANPVQGLRNIVDKFAPSTRSIISPGLAFIFTGVRKILLLPPTINYSHFCCCKPIGSCAFLRYPSLGRGEGSLRYSRCQNRIWS